MFDSLEGEGIWCSLLQECFDSLEGEGIWCSLLQECLTHWRVDILAIGYRGGSRVFVEGGFDLRLSGLCVQLARLNQPA